VTQPARLTVPQYLPSAAVSQGCGGTAARRVLPETTASFYRCL